MKMNKKITKIAVSLAALLVGVALVGGTLSYLTSMAEPKVNVFSVGSVATELLEPEFRVEGTTISKNPYVTNVGDVDCLVRMKVEISPKEIQVPLDSNPSYIDLSGKDAEMSSEKAAELWDDGYRFWLNFNTNEEQDTPWVYNAADGFWYYQGVITPGQDTSELFTEVKWLITEDGTFKDIQDFDIYIKKEATYAVYYDKNGTEHSTLTQKDGGYVYDHEKALTIWQVMQGVGKIY